MRHCSDWQRGAGHSGRAEVGGHVVPSAAAVWLTRCVRAPLPCHVHAVQASGLQWLPEQTVWQGGHGARAGTGRAARPEVVPHHLREAVNPRWGAGVVKVDMCVHRAV
jgi:hypothetical protein